MDIIPALSVYPDRLCIYSLYEGTCNIKKDSSFITSTLPASNIHDGNISSKSRKKIQSAIDLLLYIANDKTVIDNFTGNKFLFKINFITLTLSSTQRHSDKFIKDNMLRQFLTEASQKFNLTNYLWRAEAQKNGNIHFHIVTDTFLPWLWIQSTWNRIQNKYGYIDIYACKMRQRYKNGFAFNPNDAYTKDYKTQFKRYKKAASDDFYKPNSTDVHSIKRIKNISSYLSKYCTKNPANLCAPVRSRSNSRYYAAPSPGKIRSIEGNLWNLSNSLSRFKPMREIIGSQLEKCIDYFKAHFPEKYKFYEYCSVIYISVNLWSKISNFPLTEMFNAHLQNFF